MKISKDKIEFTNGSITLKTSPDGESRMDCILSMLADQIMSSLKHLNHKELWAAEPEMLQVMLPLPEGTARLSVINMDGNRIRVSVDGKTVEEANEHDFALNFLRNVQDGLPELLSDFRDQEYVYSQLKADLRSDLNHLELAIDRYET